MRHAATLRIGLACLLLGMLLRPTVAWSEGGATASSSSEEAPCWSASSTWRASRGIHRLEAAPALLPGQIVISWAGEYSLASDFLLQGDSNQHRTQRISVAYSPLGYVEASFSHAAIGNTNSLGVPKSVQSLGDPVIGLKGGGSIVSGFGLGGGVWVLLPTSPGGNGLKPSALVMDATLAASYRPVSQLQLALNVGYVYDNTRKLFKREIDPVQRFTAGVAQVNRIKAGVGVEGDLQLASFIVLAPFVEFTAALGQGLPVTQSPMRLTGGLKTRLFRRGLVEIVFGGDYRITGAPVDGGKLPGIPPWEVFGRVVAHLYTMDEAPESGGGCSSDIDCPSAGRCMAGTCVITKEVDREVVKEVHKPVPTFTIAGTVLADEGGKPITGATVHVSGYDKTALAVDFNTGGFQSFPLPIGEGLVQVRAEAPGHRSAEQTVPRGKANEVKTVGFKLHAIGGDVFGELKGSLKDARSGRPVVGQVFLPKLNKRVRTQQDGTFHAKVKPGRYQVLITARRYITQKKEVEIRMGEVHIMNVDLRRKR